ncbi:serine/threonine-protein phosphatase 2A regulatory subunit B'' subunit alpha [Diachasma alloeum]|uniref:serine/threonine-protein phosphatase 2A regulatory subunit B'' subunit alpha n=1 Tax=Diachasma alloeum TaxID=454923 RepID=UPI0007383BA2|nr:serine/threonine-protein phosphatase 2A regulatory subunit B'' subunit alpha [Diachasma alloeum]XP_015120262.1 serine/threonine-protein phosphatase 2A regulatory subunit B'' subunit alpha [Diachasma alloeum]
MYTRLMPEDMAATAKHEVRPKFPGDPGEEDIAAIAKQISDHAEAIYQTWKSRGLAPTEILNCHSNATAADKFGSALTPNISQKSKKFVEPLEAILTPDRPGNSRLASQEGDTSLVKLVNNFVVEDRARQRSYLSKTLPSSIQFALDKFERNSQTSQKPQIQVKPKIVPKPLILTTNSETIETILPGEPAKRPLSVLLGSPVPKVQGNENLAGSQGSGMTTWPLKNKLFSESTSAGCVASKSNQSAAAYLDEVAREEERLINALKTGAVISEETGIRQKPAIIKEKPKLTANGIVAEQALHFLQQKQKIEERKGGKGQGKGQDGKEEGQVTRWGPRITSPRPRAEQVPHPELTSQQKQHIRAAAAAAAASDPQGIVNPVRPFLTRGSVAERVLIFEKCPSELLLDKRGPRVNVAGGRSPGGSEGLKTQSYVRERIQQQQSKALPPHTTLQRHVKANKNVRIPRFYFPGGKPTPLSQIEATIAKITKAFESLPGNRATRGQFHVISKACDLPIYWKVPLFLAAGGDKSASVEMLNFLNFWRDICKTHHDAASKFVRIVTRGLRETILPEDLVCLIQDVVETHPGLTFLKEATEFHSRYVHTVIARIFYCVNRSWSGKISSSEVRRSNLLETIAILEHEEDINQVTSYFSYEHFYVIYCKFWELDRDHDLLIDKMDLTRHNDHALSTRLIERIFSGAVTRGGKGRQADDKMTYTEFVWFLLSEEDKNHPTAVEYWFRCMDLDGDGYLSMYELEYFYEEQLHRMEAIGMETLPFEDCLCQMLDMIHPEIPGKISLRDLKRCKMTSIFFDTFFNLEKYLDHEQRDPFATTGRDQDAEGHEMSDWDRFAADEYELLVAEESGNDQNDQMLYDPGMEEDAFSPNLDSITSDPNGHCKTRDCYARDYSKCGESKGQSYDSGDSDDYAESDN